MWPHEANREEERLARVLLNQIDRLRRRLAVGVDHVIAVRLHHDECIPAHDWPFELGIPFQRLTVARCLPLGAGAVEPLRPRRRVIRAIAVIIVGPVIALLDASRHAHVINLAHPRRVVACLFKMLRPRRAVADSRARTGVAEHTRRVGIVAGHKRRSRRPAISPLAQRARESGPLRGEPVNVRRLAGRVSVARQRRSRQIIRNYEQDIGLRRGGGGGRHQ